MDSKTLVLVQKWYDDDESLGVLAKRIDALIKDQREMDAKICEEHYTIEGIAQRCATAIRMGI